jgi:hypothetical protein
MVEKILTPIKLMGKPKGWKNYYNKENYKPKRLKKL